MNNEHCTEQGCTSTTDTSSARSGHRPESADELTIDVVSDVICPWCFIGKRRLEKALSMLGQPAGVRVVWKPFQLNPHMPVQGVERRTYRTAKFGSWERSQALDAQVAAAGADEGIAFAFDKMTRTPNTLDAHRLIWLARETNVQDAIVETLFRAYFIEGLNLNDRPTLLALAVQSGIPATHVEPLLAGEEGRAEVLEEEDLSKALGVNGVPSLFLNGQPTFSGAVAAPLLADAIRRALRK
jgi:predicted DsbA family dithiol-disulfide isomerase